MSDFDTIIYEKDDGIAYVTLHRPQVLNAINIQMRDDLYEVLTAIGDDPEVLVAILKGAGDRAFSAGADVTEFGTAPSIVAAREARWERNLWGLFLSLRKPLIAAIHGYALGAGVEMALCCDIRIASQDSQLGLPEVALGLLPAAGGSQNLPRLIGRGRALELLLTGERIGAEEAYRLGLVNRVVPKEYLLPTAQKLATRICSMDQGAVRMCKEAVNRGLDMTLEQGLALEKESFAQIQRASGRWPFQSILVSNLVRDL